METTGEELGQLSKRLIGSMELAEGKLEQLCPRPADTVTEEVRGLQLHIERLQDTMDKVTFQQGCMAKELDKLGNVITQMAEAMFDVVFLALLVRRVFNSNVSKMTQTTMNSLLERGASVDML